MLFNYIIQLCLLSKEAWKCLFTATDKILCGDIFVPNPSHFHCFRMTRGKIGYTFHPAAMLVSLRQLSWVGLRHTATIQCTLGLVVSVCVSVGFLVSFLRQDSVNVASQKNSMSSADCVSCWSACEDRHQSCQFECINFTSSLLQTWEVRDSLSGPLSPPIMQL